MFSSLQRLFRKLLGLSAVDDRLEYIETTLQEIQQQQHRYSAMQFYIEEAERMYEEDLVKLEKDLQEVILQNVEPYGEA